MYHCLVPTSQIFTVKIKHNADKWNPAILFTEAELMEVIERAFPSTISSGRVEITITERKAK